MTYLVAPVSQSVKKFLFVDYGLKIHCLFVIQVDEYDFLKSFVD